MDKPQTGLTTTAENSARVVLGLIAALVAAVFGGMSYAQAVSPAPVPATSLVARPVRT